MCARIRASIASWWRVRSEQESVAHESSHEREVDGLDPEHNLRHVLEHITDHSINRVAEPLLWYLSTPLDATAQKFAAFEQSLTDDLNRFCDGDERL